ncbi:peptidoglycan-binding protein [Streptomyces sp. NPDC058751]|uniref:peptidoglycan-binding protein n=1 Tax=Streptomyces sp. NPDC058751 TaxID=3346623 RepID=UPI0036BD6379
MPESLASPVRRLVVQMRQSKDHSGLSLSALANRTGYSRSSWERCLNGRALPPLWALEALADVCGGDRAKLTALWEVAASTKTPEAPEAPEAERSHGSSEVPAAADVNGGHPDVTPEAVGPDAPGRAARRGAVAVVSTAATLALLVTAGVLAAAQWRKSSAQPRGTAEQSVVPVSTYSPRTFPCYFTERDGLTYAGHSTTLTDPYHVGVTVEAVAEVQCLVERHGFDPQGIDGSFGPNTKDAVQRFQRSRGLDDDGVVGPGTWRALREPRD